MTKSTKWEVIPSHQIFGDLGQVCTNRTFRLVQGGPNQLQVEHTSPISRVNFHPGYLLILGHLWGWQNYNPIYNGFLVPTVRTVA